MKLNDRSRSDVQQDWAKAGKKLTLLIVPGGIAMQSDLSPREALTALLSAANVAASAILVQGAQVGVAPNETRKLVQAIVKEHFPLLENPT